MGEFGRFVDQCGVHDMDVIDPDLPGISLEMELASFVDSATDRALFLTSPDGRIASWNRGAELLTGWRLDQVRGRPVDLFYTQRDVAMNHPAADRDQAAKSSPLRAEAWRIRKDGSEFLADVTIFALRNDVQ